MRDKLNDAARLELMLEAIGNIESFTEGIATYEQFASNKILCHAVTYNLQCIGESVYSVEQTGGFGNIIVVESQIAVDDQMQDIKTLSLQYCHLQFDNAVAINPRTGMLFTEGDKVYRGDLIGYTGRTGNAVNKKDVPNPHLHLGASFDGKNGDIPKGTWIDPMAFINGSIDIDNIQQKEGIIENIKCD